MKEPSPEWRALEKVLFITINIIFASLLVRLVWIIIVAINNR